MICAAGEDPAGLAGEQLEDAELLGRQRDRAPATRTSNRPASTSRSPTRSTGWSLPALTAGAAQQRAHPGRQLARAVRLGDVVVGADVEAEQHVVLGGAGGHQQDRHVGLGAQDPAHVEPVDQRHHHVEHDQVGPARAALVQRGPPVADREHAVALAFQVEPDQLGLLGVVVGDQDPGTHRRTL